MTGQLLFAAERLVGELLAEVRGNKKLADSESLS